MKLHYEAISPAIKDLLFQLMQKSYLEEFHLVGGTALALMLGHRQSVDIDLFTISKFEADTLKNSLETDFSNCQILRSSSYGLSCQINDIKTDIYYWNEDLLNPVMEIDGIRLISDDDIFAMKLEAITTRCEKKDFMDIAQLLTTQTLDWGIACHQRKYKQRDTALIMSGLASLEEAEDSFMPLMLNGMTWPQAQEMISNAVKEFVWLEKLRVRNKKNK
ncbi:MAG: nucleotidyl transferase AbiEii/AbiGii toxin family protein [Runella sp.]